MVKIRMSRYGRKHSPFYKIVVVDSRKPRESDYIEQVGHYDPQHKENLLLKKDRIEYWVGQGAQTTEGVKELISRAS